MGADRLYGDESECVFAAVGYDQRDLATGHTYNHGGYDDGLHGDLGCSMYGDGECSGGGGELCGSDHKWSQWDGGWGVDGVGVQLSGLG